MNPKFPHPSVAEWETIDWPNILSTAPKAALEQYYSAICRALRTAEAAGDQSQVRPLALAACLTSMLFQTEDGSTRLGPYHEYANGQTSVRVTDFTNEQLDVLASVLPGISDPDFAARVADILWTRRPHEQTAKLAANSYLEAAKRLENDPFEFQHRFTRGFQIAASIRSDRYEYEAFASYGMSLLERFQEEDPNHMMDDIAKVMYHHKQGEPKAILVQLLQKAEHLTAEKKFLRAEQFYELARKFAIRASDKPSERNSIEGQAESCASYASEFDDGNPHCARTAAFHYGRAFHVYREAGKEAGFEKRITELHQRMVQCQELGMTSFQPFTVSTDIPPAIIGLVEQTKGLDWMQALGHLIRHCSVSRLENLRKTALKTIDGSPLANVFPTVLVKESGKTDAYQTPRGGGVEPPEERIRQEMLSIASRGRSFVAEAFLEPVRRILVEEHKPTNRHLAGLVVNNNFVPAGRENSYLAGLMFGMAGDYATAAHLLIPQLENSVRFILSKAGNVPSGFDQDGIQDEFDLNRTLHMKELSSVLDDDLRFELVGLLIDRHGNNVRNMMMHGLVSDPGMDDPQLCYLWGLTLRILAIHVSRPDGQSEETTNT